MGKQGKASRHRTLAAVVSAGIATAAALLAVAPRPGSASAAVAHTASASPPPVASIPSRGTQLYTTNFNPSSFNQTVVGGSASLTQGSGPSLVCTVGSGGSKMIASVANWSVTEPTSIWAENDIRLNSMSGQYVASFYFEGIGGNHRHLHIDYSNDTITLRDPNYRNEGPLVSVPGLGNGSTFHLVVVDTSPRYRVYVNGTQVIDYMDSFAASVPGGFGFDCASQNNGTGADTVSNLSLYTVSGACAAGWTCADIGSPTPTGTESVNGASWAIQGGGSDIQGTSDQFHYVWSSLAADGAFSARVVSQGNTNAWAKAGVMLRATSDPAAANYSVLLTPGNGIQVQDRPNSGAPTDTLQVPGATPLYLKVTRAGTIFSASTSADGTNWTAVPGSTKTIAMTGALLVGFAVTSHNTSVLSSTAADNFVVSVAQASGCPSGWSCADVGSPTPVGTQSLSGTVWTIKGGGSDIQGTSDHFHYVWQSLPGDGSVSAHVTSQTNTSTWAKAGVMLRSTADPAAAYYAAFLTPGNGVEVQYRAASGGGTASFHVAGKLPLYLRVTRSASTFSASTSTDGVTWTLIAGSTKSLNVSGPLLAGVAVTSHNSTALGIVTADSVSA